MIIFKDFRCPHADVTISATLLEEEKIRSGVAEFHYTLV